MAKRTNRVDLSR